MTYEIWWKTLCKELGIPETSNFNEVRETISYLIDAAKKVDHDSHC